MARRLNIKNFKVTNTTNGNMAQSGRESITFTTETTIISGLTKSVSVVNNTLTQITDENLLNENVKLCSSYIKIIREYKQDQLTAEEVFIPDGIMRITYLSSKGATYNSSLLYAFSSLPTTKINELTWNVCIANSLAQEEGDYFDIELPDSTYYPTLYVCFLIIKDAWVLREVVDINKNICKINNISRFHFCVNPQKCYYDYNRSHYICLNGLDETTGIRTRVVFGVEDDRKSVYCNRDFCDLIFSLSNRLNINDITLP